MGEGPNNSPAPVAGRGAGGECGPAAWGTPLLGANPRSRGTPPPPRPTASPREPPAAGEAPAGTIKLSPRSPRRETPGDRRGTTGSPGVIPTPLPPFPPPPPPSPRTAGCRPRGSRPCFPPAGAGEPPLAERAATPREEHHWARTPRAPQTAARPLQQ